MNTKDMYKYALEHKWKPILEERNQHLLSDTTWNNKCIFCADTTDNIEYFIGGHTLIPIHCGKCKVDERICIEPTVWDGNNCLLSLLKVYWDLYKGQHDDSYLELFYDVVEEIIEIMESYL